MLAHAANNVNSVSTVAALGLLRTASKIDASEHMCAGGMQVLSELGLEQLDADTRASTLSQSRWAPMPRPAAAALCGCKLAHTLFLSI